MSKINKIKLGNVEYDIEDSTVDTKLANKQNKLNEGSNIDIDETTNTISATDTTYAGGTNVTIDSDNKINVPTATNNSLGVVKAGTNVTISSDGSLNATGSGGTTDYDSLENRPYINSKLLTGNKSSSELGLASASHNHSIDDVTNLKSSLDDINNKIPSEATASNQLADKSFVDDSISSATSDMQVVSNKSTSLTGTGDDTHYPTTKAVIDYHDNTKENISNKRSIIDSTISEEDNTYPTRYAVATHTTPFTNHINSRDNPHQVKNTQLGNGYGVVSEPITSENVIKVSLDNYELKDNGIVGVKFSYSVPSNSYLNIHEQGDIPIYYKGNPIIDGLISANDTVFFIYEYNESSGTHKYHAITDKLINGTTIKTVQGNELLGSGNVSILESELVRRNFTYLNERVSSCTSDTLYIDGYYDYTSGTDQAYIDGIVIDKDLTIVGVDCTINGQDYARAFTITNGAKVVFKNIKFEKCKSSNDWGDGGAIYGLSGNSIDLINCEFSNCTTYFKGGAVHGPVKTAIDCKFHYCKGESSSGSVPYGGAIYNYYNGTSKIINTVFYKCESGYGGAIYNIHPMYIENSSFTECSAVDGGAIESYNIEVDNSSFINCIASNNGGAINITYYNNNSPSNISNCSFEKNTSSSGGAIRLTKIDYISNCSFSDNDASSDESDAIYVATSCNIYDCKFDDVGYTSIVGSNVNIINCGFLNSSGTSPWITNGTNCYDDNSSYLVTNTTLQTGLSGKSDTSHTHSTWVDKSSELGELVKTSLTSYTYTHYFYVNEALRLANYVISITIPKTKTTTATTRYNLSTDGVIPTGYVPPVRTSMPLGWYASLSVNEEGNIILYDQTAKGSTAEWNLDYNIMWRY